MTFTSLSILCTPRSDSRSALLVSCLGIICLCFGSVRCIWSAWGGWSVCSKSCGGGVKTRTRLCTGAGCQTQTGYENTPCNIHVCFCVQEWGEWGAWETCLNNCRQNRARQCTRSTTLGCPTLCIGYSSDSRFCEHGPQCKEPGCNSGDVSWNQWHEWDPCIMKPELEKTVKCGDGGYTVRRRSCGVKVRTTQCPTDCSGEQGSQFDEKDCYVCCSDDLTEPATAEWSLWKPWGPCNASCGHQGLKTRLRECLTHGKTEGCQDPFCYGSDMETTLCSKDCCGLTTQTWESWTGWGACSVTCGNGFQTRSRVCLKPPPSSVGPGPCEACGANDQPRDCELDSCPGSQGCDSSSWTTWAPWTTCTATCGGEQTSTRSCHPPGCSCPGLGFRSVLCPGAVLVHWSEWSEYGPCLAECDAEGLRSKSRVCSSAECECSGKFLHTNSCTGPVCSDTASEPGLSTHIGEGQVLITDTTSFPVVAKRHFVLLTYIVEISAITIAVAVVIAAATIAVCYRRRLPGRRTKSQYPDNAGSRDPYKASVMDMPSAGAGVAVIRHAGETVTTEPMSTRWESVAMEPQTTMVEPSSTTRTSKSTSSSSTESGTDPAKSSSEDNPSV